MESRDKRGCLISGAAGVVRSQLDNVTSPRTALDKDGGLPSAHALSYVADRLAEIGNEALSDAILNAQLKVGIQTQNVRHLTFVLSGNNPEPHLTTSLQAYAGGVEQWTVGLRIEGHAAFVAAVYDLVIANANN
ncbi:hypothetical protein [Rhizobium anhuiense]|uniref:hypothetical protein n=1 Tax=Rhizobium anhuiense TaxID=1184720 RepID=UPI00117A6806|nr:hypothetical protein [Rhizobium anhuiense]